MRIPHLYLPQPLHSGSLTTLSQERKRYLCRVLRLQHGAPLTVFNGKGGQYQATLALPENGPAAAVRIGQHQPLERESPLPITLLQGISRGERMETTLRKATELGINAILPLFTARCEVRLQGQRLARRITHWQGIIISACEQSGRNRLPELQHPRQLPDALASRTHHTALLLDPLANQRLTDLPAPAGPVSLLTGPEGGFAPDELALARQHGYRGLRLGPRVLRAETAPLAALAAMQILWGDF